MKRIGLLVSIFFAVSAVEVEAVPGTEYAGIIKQRANIEREFKRFENEKTTPVKALVLTEFTKASTLKLGQVSVINNNRLPANYVLKRFKLHSGDTIDLKKLEQKINTYNNANISKLQAIVSPNEDKASCNIALKVIEPKHRHNDTLFIDNTGLRATGELRTGYHGSSYGWLHNDDHLQSIRYWSRGVLSNTTVYEMPLFHHGLRGYGGFNRDRVRGIQGKTKYNYKAYANDLWAGVKHPLIANEKLKLEVFGELHHKWDNTDFDSSSWRDSKTELAKLGLYLRSLDKKSVTCVKLTGNIYRDNKEANILSDADSKGSYWQGFFWRKQELGKKQTLLVRAYGQYTDKLYLPSTETMSLGGEYSVRGFEEALLEGSKGLLGTIEYGFPISRQSLRGNVFYDCGLVYDNKEMGLGKNSLTSCGIGLEYSKKGWYGKLSLGIPLSNPQLDHRSKTRTHIFLQRSI